MVVFVCVVFMLLFGFLGLSKMPYQLMPEVSRPVISIYTNWAGATPQEIEKEIINRQEKYLKGIEGLEYITSTARSGRGIVGLEFKGGVDVNVALLKVSAKMDEIKGYPNDVDKPVIAISGESIPPAIYLFMRTLEGNEREVDTYKTFFEDYILQHLERIQGVGEVFYPGGRASEMHILLDSKQLAFHNVSINEVIQAITNHNKNTTAGSLDYGMRTYKIKVQSEFSNASDILHTPIKHFDNKILYLQDLAVVSEGFAKQTSYGFLNDTRALSVQIVPMTDANVLELSKQTRRVVQELNDGILKDNGLELVWSRDQEGYILSAISVVKGNIILGIILACVVLYVFLRGWYSMFVVLLCMPICVISAFFFLNLLGRSLNVISLAGISFAMSMLIDNAIVVVENISRHLKENKDYFSACVNGVREVIGAIFASVVTTIAIFIPIMNMGEDLGQLFYDIALSVCFGLGISFFVSLFVIPSMLYNFALFNEKKSVELRYKEVRAFLRDSVKPKIALLYTRLCEALAPIKLWQMFAKIRPIFVKCRAFAWRIFENLKCFALQIPNVLAKFWGKLVNAIKSLLPHILRAWSATKQYIDKRESLKKPLDRIASSHAFEATKNATKNFTPCLQNAVVVCKQGRALDSLHDIGIRAQSLIMTKLEDLLANPKHCIRFILAFMGLCVLISLILFPKLDYLPKGNQNFIIGYLNAPPGTSYEQRKEIGESIFLQNKHLIESLGYKQKSSSDLPPIKHLFFTGNENYMQLGVTSSNPDEVARLIPQIRKTIQNIPDLQASIVQQGIFDKGSSTQSIYINIVGEELDSIISTAISLQSALKAKIPSMQVRPLPALENTNREIMLYPDYVALALNGFDAKSFGEIVDVVLDGKQIDEFKTPSGKTIDLVLKALPDLSIQSVQRAKESIDFQSPEDIGFIQIYTPSGKIVPLSSLSDIRQEYTMAQVRHYERERTILLVLSPPANLPIEEILQTIKQEIIPELESSGELRDNRLVFGGAAKDLQDSRGELFFGFCLALFITYLILCALYGNFSYPFIIIFTVPFAVAGGLMGLRLVDTFLHSQNLDMLSLLGFIILVGSVVNNAILIIYQTQFNLSYGMPHIQSIIESTKSRIRPISMSILTSVFGLLPLVVFGGAGSEIYRGLGSVIIGGLLFSGVLSVFVIPCALLVFFKWRYKIT